MDIERYADIRKNEDSTTFSFISDGRYGQLTKVVIFYEMPQLPQTYNLALGTIRGLDADFEETTNNGDRDKILSTVFHIARVFSAFYPDQRIFVRGRDRLTTRLYRAAINHSYDQLIDEFVIYGGVYQQQRNNFDFEYLKRDKFYDAFLFERR